MHIPDGILSVPVWATLNVAAIPGVVVMTTMCGIDAALIGFAAMAGLALARMRTEYVIPLQGQIAARIEQLEGDKAKATSTSHRKKLQKEQDDLKKQQTELLTFEEKLKHAADQKISLDLDDGVKVNYAKFGDLLAESKAITGGKEEE